MTAHTHLTFSLASAIAILQLKPSSSISLPLVFVVLLGSLAPDIDSQRTALHSSGSLFQFLLPQWLQGLIDRFTRLFAKLVRLFFSHRGVLHSPFIALCLYCLAYKLNSLLLFWFWFAYAGHLLLDYCTRGGIPLFSPFSKRLFSAGFCKTGSYLELVFCAGLICYIVSSTIAAIQTSDSWLYRSFQHTFTVIHSELLPYLVYIGL